MKNFFINPILILSTIMAINFSLFANNVTSPQIASRDVSIINHTGSPLKLLVLNKAGFDDVEFMHTINVGDAIGVNNIMEIHMHNESVFPVYGLGFYIELQGSNNQYCEFEYDDPAVGPTHIIKQLGNTKCNNMLSSDKGTVVLTSTS
jgi:hypothetical protein